MKVKLKLLQLRFHMIKLRVILIYIVFGVFVVTSILGFVFEDAFNKHDFYSLSGRLIVLLLVFSLISSLFVIKSKEGFMYISQDKIVIEYLGEVSEYLQSEIEVGMTLKGYEGENYNKFYSKGAMNFKSGINHITITKNGQVFKFDVLIEYKKQIDELKKILNHNNSNLMDYQDL